MSTNATSTPMFARMMGWELRLIARRRTTVLSLLLAPVIVLSLPVVAQPTDPVVWAYLAGLAALVCVLVSVYSAATSTLTARRESMALARLRTGELPGELLLGATLATLALIGIVQGVVVLGVFVALGAPVPVSPGLVLLGLVGGAVVAVTAALVTSSLSATAEGVQYAVLPLLLAAAIGGQILQAPVDDIIRSAVLLIPATPVVDLIARAWIGTTPEMVTLPVSLPAGVADLLLLAGWSLLLLSIARRRWRWTPRG